MDTCTDRRLNGRMDGRLEIHPCVLQDIGPLGPLPKKGVELEYDAHFGPTLTKKFRTHF